MGRLSGLRPQPLAQLAVLGRRHQRLLHHRSRPHLGQGTQLRRGPDVPPPIREHPAPASARPTRRTRRSRGSQSTGWRRRSSAPGAAAGAGAAGGRSAGASGSGAFGGRAPWPRQLSHVPGRAARRRQQGHRAEELPQRHPARLLHPQGRPLRHPGHRRRQPHHRQPEDRHRPRRHGHRLLPQRARLQLHRQLALGRRHLPQVQLRPGLRRATENINIANCYVAGCWELGSVLDGTWKRRPKPAAMDASSAAPSPTADFINIAISNCVFEGCQGLALETVDGALLEDIAITNITMRDIASCPSSCVSARACAAPRGCRNRP